MDAFERSSRAGVTVGIVLVLIAAAYLNSTPRKATPTGRAPLTATVAESLKASTDPASPVDIIHDQERFVAWTTNQGLQQCLTVVIATDELPETVIWDLDQQDVKTGTVCSPPGTRPTDSLLLYKAVSDEQSRYGVVVVALPDHYASEEWSVTVDQDPTRIIRDANTFAFEYDQDTWRTTTRRVGFEIVCSCGDTTLKADLQ